MTKHELVSLFYGLKNGTRPFSDIFADWPTKTLVKFPAYPGHVETPAGIPISLFELIDIEENYPKIKVIIRREDVEETMARLKWHVAAGREIYVPIIETEKKEKEEEERRVTVNLVYDGQGSEDEEDDNYDDDDDFDEAEAEARWACTERKTETETVAEPEPPPLPDYMYPLRDPKKWRVIAHPHHPGHYFYEEIPQEEPYARYNIG